MVFLLDNPIVRNEWELGAYHYFGKPPYVAIGASHLQASTAISKGASGRPPLSRAASSLRSCGEVATKAWFRRVERGPRWKVWNIWWKQDVSQNMWKHAFRFPTFRPSFLCYKPRVSICGFQKSGTASDDHSYSDEVGGGSSIRSYPVGACWCFQKGVCFFQPYLRWWCWNHQCGIVICECPRVCW